MQKLFVAVAATHTLLLTAVVYLTLPYLTFGVGRLLHLPSAEAVSVRPNAQPRCNQKVTVIGCEAEQVTSPRPDAVAGILGRRRRQQTRHASSFYSVSDDRTNQSETADLVYVDKITVTSS